MWEEMGSAGVVKSLICCHLEGELEPLRSGQRSWGGGQATHRLYIRMICLKKWWKKDEKRSKAVKMVSKL